MNTSMNPFDVVTEFENVVAEYAGAPYAVALESCTAALFLSCRYYRVGTASIPARTFISVPNAIVNAGGTVQFRRKAWQGVYWLRPYPILDAALRFRRGMFGQEDIPNDTLMCLSFHYKKHLKIGRGGMILTGDPDAAAWLRRARNCGRGPCELNEDRVLHTGWRMFMMPEDAARGLHMMYYVADDNPDIEEHYDDLSLLTDQTGRSIFTRGMNDGADDYRNHADVRA